MADPIFKPRCVANILTKNKTLKYTSKAEGEF